MALNGSETRMMVDKKGGRESPDVCTRTSGWVNLNEEDTEGCPGRRRFGGRCVSR